MKKFFLKIWHWWWLNCKDGGASVLGSQRAPKSSRSSRGRSPHQIEPRLPLLKICLAGAMLLAGALQAAALDGVVIIANEDVPGDSISAAALKDIYTGKTTYWEDGQSVQIAVLTDQAGATDAALKEASGMDGSHFKIFWQRMVFSGRGQQPDKANDAASLVALVASTKGAIALVPADAVLKGVKKLEIK